ncbi:hypothetical protein [Sulfurimonas sp.]|uniref:hypothetical protein n=1 Tax=Sulfurimonas sp. TaxID=2022749 RepID=UPI00356869A1
MLKLSAVLLNTYKSDEYINKDSGTTTPSKNRFQMLIKKPMRNGTMKQELHDLTVKDEVYNKYKDSIGKTIEIDVGYFGQNITFFGI